MPKDLPPDAEGPHEADGYEPPAELDGPDEAQPVEDDADAAAPTPPRRAGLSSGLKVGLALALAAVLAGTWFAYRTYHRARTLKAGLAKADASLRLDTAEGYKRAAFELDEPLTAWFPVEAGSVRAFALAMLAADYRDADAGATAQALLVEPGRAEQVPASANLASAALFLGRRAVGDATTYAGRARGSAWGLAIQARLAVLAGNVEGGMEPAAAAVAADPRLPAAQAILGDLSRRARGDAAAARVAYAAALAESKVHPRAAYGLAKLALASEVPLGEALPHLRDLAADGGTPAPERGRAAIYLAAIHRRAGDRTAADAALDAARLDPQARAWADRAVVVLSTERRPYRAVQGAPGSLQSASDDDPPELSPDPPPPPPPPPPPAPPPRKKAAPPPAKRPAAATAKRPPAPAKKAAPAPKAGARK